jgi:hypothetical protein
MSRGNVDPRGSLRVRAWLPDPLPPVIKNLIPVPLSIYLTVEETATGKSLSSVRVDSDKASNGG